MSNPPAATLGADELLAPLGGRRSGRCNNRRARQDWARRNGNTRSGGRARGLHWRPHKSVDYLGLIPVTCFPEQRTHVAPPTALARAAIGSSVMFWSPASTKETYCCVRPVRAAN